MSTANQPAADTSPTTERTARLVAALVPCALPTARKYLAGQPVKGMWLRERLAVAAKRAAEILAETPAAAA